MTTYEDLLAELVSQGLTLSLPSSNISELWTNGPHFDKTRDKELEIEKAVLTGHLKGVPKLRDPNYPTGYRKIPVDDWHHIRDCWFAGSFVSYDITRADFREWLTSRGDWPLPETCLLSKWWTTENLEESETKHAIQEDLENTVRLASILHVEEETEKAWENEDYDGVLGLPPDWVSKPVLDQFKDARNRMLEKWKYNPKDAQEWVERYSRAGEENNDWFYPALFPCGNEMEPQYFLETVGRLAHIRWAVSLGAENGLKELAGDCASQGYAIRQASKGGRKDKLRLLIENAYRNFSLRHNRQPTNKEILDCLVENDNQGKWNNTIQEIDYEGGKICWLDRRGNEKTTAFSTFYGRMTEIRKSLSAK